MQTTTIADVLSAARPGVRRLFEDADTAGWQVHVIRGTQVRMWCPCLRRHGVWFETQPKDRTYEKRHRARLAEKTCWKE